MNAPSVFVAEGLLMYLPETAVRELFQQVADGSGAASRVVFTFVGRRPDGRPDAGPYTGLALWSVKLIGEPWRCGHPPERLDDFLRPCGWRALAPEGGAPVRVGIEHLAVAGRTAD